MQRDLGFSFVECDKSTMQLQPSDTLQSSEPEILAVEINRHQAELFLEAIQLVLTDRPLVDISRHLPLLVTDQEVHAFNLYGHIPARLQGKTSDTAMWLLESESLRRSMVCKVLVRNHVGQRVDDLNNKSILSILAKKICSLDVAAGFVDGLKYLLPVVGAVGEDNTTSGSQQRDIDMRIILSEYATAHMKYSANLLFSSASVAATASGFEGIQDITPTLVAVAYCVLNLCRHLQEGITPHSKMMSDFFADLRAAVSESDASRFISSHNLSIKFMTDLFNQTAAGRPLSALKPPAGLASHLFTHIRLEGIIAVGFLGDAGTNVDAEEGDAEDISKKLLHAKLCDDALYLFSLNATATAAASTASAVSDRIGSLICDHGMMVGCIPLETAQVSHVDVIRSPSLLGVTSISHRSVPYVSFAAGSTSTSAEDGAASGSVKDEDATYRVAFKGISFHRKILLDVCPSPAAYYSGSIGDSVNGSSNNSSSSSAAADDRKVRAASSRDDVSAIHLVDEWIDTIENSCWQSRSQMC